MQWSHWFAGMMDIAPDDRMYDCLPMYHSIGGVVAIGAPSGARRIGGDPRALLGEPVLGRRRRAGLHVVPVYRRAVPLSRQRARASARRAAPALRLSCGNGLRARCLGGFQSRFAIPQILEFYAATEGNFSLYNGEGKPGAIGRIPSFLAHRFPVALVEVRSRHRRAVARPRRVLHPLRADEAGEAIGQIAMARPAARLRGLHRRRGIGEEGPARRLRRGDAWYRTGDLMRRDRSGYFLFRRPDRRHLSLEGRERVDRRRSPRRSPPVPASPKRSSTAFTVPGAEGRAGMAAIVVDGLFDLRGCAGISPAPARLRAAGVPADARSTSP